MHRILYLLSMSMLLTIFPSFASEPYSQIETHRELQFENEYVKVWKTVIMPNQPLKMHRHDSGRVVVGLKGGSLTKIEETGETSELVLETGKAYWLAEDPKGTLHGDINESDEPIEVMVIEVKQNTP